MERVVCDGPFTVGVESIGSSALADRSKDGRNAVFDRGVLAAGCLLDFDITIIVPATVNSTTIRMKRTKLDCTWNHVDC